MYEMSLDRLVGLQFMALVTSVTVTVCALLLEFSFVLPDTRIDLLVLMGWCLHTQAETAACLKAVYIS